MSTIWEDHEDKRIIEFWHSQKVKLVDGIFVSRKVLRSILSKNDCNPDLKVTEKFETEWDEQNQRYDPPIPSIHKRGKGLKGFARERKDDGELVYCDIVDKAIPLWEIKELRKEQYEVMEKLEEHFDMCPRCFSPKKHCSAHC